MDIKKGNILKTKDGRKWTIESFDGKYIHTVEGAQFAPNHPDIESIEAKRYEEKKVEKPVEEVKEEKFFSKKKHK